MTLQEQWGNQKLANGYELVNGVAMHEQNGDRFQIPHDVLKKQIRADHFVELRIDSSRFSVHPDAPEQCTCSLCDGEATNPILSHNQPATLVPLPNQDVPSRGWGEDFWVRVTERQDDYFRGLVDNPLAEARLHGLHLHSEILFHADHVLAVHPSHRQDMVMNMDEDDLRQLVEWLGTF